MKILLVSSYSKEAVGGISSWTKAFLDYCRDNEINCDIVNNSIIGKRLYNESGFHVFDELKRISGIVKNFNIAISKKKYEIVHINSSCSCLGIVRDYYLAKKAYKHGIRIVIHFHCDIPYQINLWNRYLSFLGNCYLTKLMRINPNIIVLCKSSKMYLKNKYNIDSIVIPNFIDKKRVIKEFKWISNEIKNICFVGHVKKDKGCDELFELAKMLPDCRFSVVGEVSERYKETINTISNVFSLGVLSPNEVLHEMDKADVFILPTYSEGFSMALLEAMSRGLPCIATDVGANKDMLENNGGIIVPVKDVDAMLSAYKRLNNKELREKQSVWNVNKVSSYYTSEIVFNKYINLYQEVLCIS